MTKIMITHNPFEVSAEITIDGTEITETSGLYKYIKTPMQDWVDDFLPTLVEYCNDDELDITFKGLQFNFDDLEEQLNDFLQKNRDYVIKPIFEPCKSHTARLGAIDDIIDEMKSQNAVEELRSEEFINSIESSEKDDLQIVIMGGTDEHRNALTDKLAPIMSAFFPSVRKEMIEAYRESNVPSEWTKRVEESLMQNIEKDLDDRTRRDIIQAIITDYVYNKLGNAAELERWSVFGGLR